MAHNLEQTAGTGRPFVIIAVFADRDGAAYATQSMQNAGVNGAGIHEVAGHGPAHPALDRLPEAERRAVSSALAENGVVLVVTTNSQNEHDLALQALDRDHDSGAVPSPQPDAGTGDDTALPDGIRGTTRDVPYTRPKDEHAGYGDTFPDHMPQAASGKGRRGLYIVDGGA
ncbi:hypothetical protein [Paracoccus benzoatiresistens]|uniref:Uncharacterized protein n=1 Tax=Paracoccus benzoatiresistens TaxID=2997341 RepID=A0ABT4J1E3_9RHOB|nr:hypothetical protein [Paracoccus sp. EF6]MCZ0960933.1 hypothetical protein [Paracoccus sp. EF6]